MLSGGGARAAYQVGVIQYMSEAFPEARFRIMTGVSAGAINTAYLANHTGSFYQSASHLTDSWLNLRTPNVFAPESGLSLLWGLIWRQNTAPDEIDEDKRPSHGLLDTNPLRRYLKDNLNAPDGVLKGIDVNLRAGRLKAVALVTTNYMTGQTVSWVQGEDTEMWERPDRISKHTELTIEHIMASTSLPLIFPAIRIDDAWYGDGGIRLSAPLAPAIHLGADRVMAISTLYKRSRAEADTPTIEGYPPTAQIVGILMNSIFQDTLDQDAHNLQRVNDLVEDLSRFKKASVRQVDLLQIRPSVDLGRLAGNYETQLPGTVRFLTSGLGTNETQSPDWLSVLLFEEQFIQQLIEVGYEDARHQRTRIAKFFEGLSPSVGHAPADAVPYGRPARLGGRRVGEKHAQDARTPEHQLESSEATGAPSSSSGSVASSEPDTEGTPKSKEASEGSQPDRETLADQET